MIRTALCAALIGTAAIFAVSGPALAQYSTVRCSGSVCQRMICAANGTYCRATSTFYRQDPYDRGYSSPGYDALFPNGARPHRPLCDSNGNNCH
jgi:hypothetical protein